MWEEYLSSFSAEEYIDVADKSSAHRPSIVIGNTAMYANGLTSHYSRVVNIATLAPDLNLTTCGFIRWIFSPWAVNYAHCEHYMGRPYLYLPSEERTLCECIQLRKYIDEGILLEAIQTYLYKKKDLTELRSVANEFGVRSLDYWIAESQEYELA